MSIDLSTLLEVLGVVVAIVASYLIGYLVSSLRKAREVDAAVKFARADTARRQRSTVGGQIAETLRPYVGDFPYDPSDLTFIGDPVDFIAFKGRSSRSIVEVAFIEVKQGAGGLSTMQRQVRDAIQGGRVRWIESRFPASPSDSG